MECWMQKRYEHESGHQRERKHMTTLDVTRRPAHHFTFAGSMGGSELHFQEGPIQEVGINGIQAPSVLIAVVVYLREISKPPHNSRETALAITKIEEAVMWLDKRTADRKERGVEGTSKL